jgi:hypothetical protein
MNVLKLVVRPRVYVTLAGLAMVSGSSITAFRPRPATVVLSSHDGSDTLVINQSRRTRLSASVLDQYGRKSSLDTAVRYEQVSGGRLYLSPRGELQCSDRREALVRATLGKLIRQVTVRCRPVQSIEAASWIDLVVGDSVRDLTFIAHAPDGSTETELRGAITVPDGSIVAAKGTTIRAVHAGQTEAIIEIGNVKTSIPIVVYEPVASFTGHSQDSWLMAMRVDLSRGDTIITPVPKAAFWVTYLSKDRSAVPPTIELVGSGSCTTGNGLRSRRVEEGVYAKYCRAETGDRMRIAHGMIGEPRVHGTVALRMMW